GHREEALVSGAVVGPDADAPEDAIRIKCRAPGLKRTFELPVAASSSVSVLIDMACELVPNLDAQFCRILGKGRVLDVQQSFAAQGVSDGATVMFVASLPDDVRRAQQDKSDATVRSFEQEEEREHRRRLASYVPEQDATYRFCKFEFCERFTEPHPFEAE